MKKGYYLFCKGLEGLKFYCLLGEWKNIEQWFKDVGGIGVQDIVDYWWSIDEGDKKFTEKQLIELKYEKEEIIGAMNLGKDSRLFTNEIEGWIINENLALIDEENFDRLL